MPESLFDPTIHQSAEPLEGYVFDNKALVAQLDQLKEQPTANMNAWMRNHPEYKSWNCAALAAYSGLSEPTLKKLKAGGIADPRGSTYWILYNKFRILPRMVLKCIPEGICNVDCANQARLKLNETTRQIEELEQRHAAGQAELDRLRKQLLRESNAAAAAGERVQVAETLLREKDARIVQCDNGILMRNRVIFILIALIICILAADMIVSSFGLFKFGPI